MPRVRATGRSGRRDGVLLAVDGGGATDLKAVEEFLGRCRDSIDGLVEHLAVVGGRDAESGDLADVLQGRRSDVLIADLGGDRRT